VLEKQLSARPYLAGDGFTVADIMMTTVLREIRKTDLIERFPALKDYFARCQARPAWRRTLRAYEVRMGAPEGAAY
jgi:glutathione S-transferase